MFAPIPPREEPKSSPPSSEFMNGSPSMPALPPPTNGTVEDWGRYAANCASRGMRTGEIRQDLLQQGLSQDLASELASQAVMSQANMGHLPAPAPTEGSNEVLYGFLWLVGGIVVSILSYSAASSGSGGGRYFVATGAIVFGAYKLIAGLARSS